MSKIHINSLGNNVMYYKDTNGTSHPITNVYFKNIYGQVFPVWPNEYWVSDVEILEYNNNTLRRTIDYSVVNGEPVYTVGNTTLSGLLPGYNYIITGTIQYGDGTVMAPITGCYFQHFTTQGSTSGCWTAGQTDFAINQITGVSEAYGIYSASNAITNALSMQSILGYHIPAASDEVVRLGFGDSINFQNLTPIILRRISIQQELRLYDINNTRITGGEQLELSPGETVRVYVKLYKSSLDDANYSSTTDAGTNDYSIVNNDLDISTVAQSQNGSYVDITAGSTVGIGVIDFNYNQNDSVVLYVNVSQPIDYRVKWYNSVINPSDDIQVTSGANLVIEMRDNTAANPTWQTYNGNNYSISSSNTSIISVSGKQLNPGSPGTSTITVTVEGVLELEFTATVPSQTALSFGYGPISNGTISYVGGANQLTEDSTASWSPRTNSTLGIKFSSDSSLNTGRTVYFDDSELETMGGLTVYASELNTGVYLFEISGSMPSSGQDTLTLNVYTDSGKTIQAGAITISINF